MFRNAILFSIFALLLSTPLSAKTSESALDATKQFVKAMLDVKQGDDSSYKNIDQFVNYEVITSNSIAPHKSRFDEKQTKKIKDDLTDLIRTIAYPRSGTFLKDSKYSYSKPQTKGNKTLVVQNTYLPKEDLELDIGYQWEKINGRWMITDITFDEDSIVQDYQNQFGRIISKNGVDGLLKKVETKLLEVKKGK